MEIKFDGRDSVWIKPEKDDLGNWKHIAIVDKKVYVDGEELKVSP